MTGPRVTQTHRTAKRALLGPVAPLAHRWALAGSPSPFKAKVVRHVVVPAVVARGKEYVREVDAGFRFGGNARDLLELYVYLFGVWEPNLTEYLRARLRPGDVFVDVGANSGWFTTLAGTLVGAQGKVVAVEASHLIAERLRANIARNELDNVRIVVAAAGSEAGEVEVELGPAEHTGLTKVHRAAAGAAGGTATVPCDTLPNLLHADEIERVRVVKIDVEGAEYDVVAGLAPHLSRFPERCEFVVEVGPRRAGTPEGVDDLMSAFLDQGYHAYRLPNDYGIPSYMLDSVPTELQRIEGRPTTETDAVFSRHDGPTLPMRPAR